MPSHSTKICDFPNCPNKIHARGLCFSHYSQQQRGKPLSPLKAKRPFGTPPQIRFEESPCPNPELEGPCHIYVGGKDDDGYGITSLNGKTIKVHRYVWEQKHGEIPVGLVIDHRCRVRPCCNVGHLRLATHRINGIENSVSIQAINAAKTHCIRGHAFTPENTYLVKRTGISGFMRQCR